MPRPRRWTDEQLTQAVAASSTLSEVCRRIGTRPGRYDLLRRHIARIGADASHLPRSTPQPARRRRWTDDELRAAVAAAATVSGVVRVLGYRPSGGAHRLIVDHIRRLGLDTSHFVGCASTRGQTVHDRQNVPQAVLVVVHVCDQPPPVSTPAAICTTLFSLAGRPISAALAELLADPETTR